MLTDRKGNELRVGDIVLVPCVVRNVDENKPHWNNVVLVTQEVNHPGQYNTELHLNALQVEKMEKGVAYEKVKKTVASKPLISISEE